MEGQMAPYAFHSFCMELVLSGHGAVFDLRAYHSCSVMQIGALAFFHVFSFVQLHSFRPSFLLLDHYVFG